MRSRFTSRGSRADGGLIGQSDYKAGGITSFASWLVSMCGRFNLRTGNRQLQEVFRATYRVR